MKPSSSVLFNFAARITQYNQYIIFVRFSSRSGLDGKSNDDDDNYDDGYDASSPRYYTTMP